MFTNFTTRTLFFTLGIAVLPLALASAQTGANLPDRVNVQSAVNLARRTGTTGTPADGIAAATALSYAKNEAYDAFDVQALLDVADGYRAIGNLDMMDTCLLDAFNQADRWGRFEGTAGPDRDGANWRYSQQMMGIIAQSKLPVRATGSAKDCIPLAKRRVPDMAAQVQNRMPDVFPGQWRTPKGRDVNIEQRGQGLRGEIVGAPFQLNITSIIGDVVTASGEYTQGGATGKLTFTLNLTHSNLIDIVMTTPSGNTNRSTLERP
jgi:hypothetical protein